MTQIDINAPKWLTNHMVQKYLPREDQPSLQQLDLKHQSQVGGPSVEFLIGYGPPLAAQRAKGIKYSIVHQGRSAIKYTLSMF